MSSEIKAMEGDALQALGMLSVPLKSLKAPAREEALSKLNHFIFFSQRVVVNLEGSVNQRDEVIALHEGTITQRDRTIRHLTVQLRKLKLSSFVAEDLKVEYLSIDPDTVKSTGKSTEKLSVALEDDISDVTSLMKSKLSIDPDTVKSTGKSTGKSSVVLEDDTSDEDDDALFHRLQQEGHK
jgi:hypothetical protein